MPGALVTGLTITGGRITEPGNQLGGGVRVEDFLFGIDDVTVRDNRILPTEANSFGGGIAAMGPATLIVQNSKVSGNVVRFRDETGSSVGGGIFVEGDFAAGSTELVDHRLGDHGQPSHRQGGRDRDRRRDLRPRPDHDSREPRSPATRRLKAAA